MKLYNTRIIKITHPLSDDQLLDAAQALRSGELVAFPTETVYGLGANALDSAATAAIFEAKGRPSDNPLIVHVADPEDIDELIAEPSEIARRLLEAFAPGPLTLVLPRSCKISDTITAGLNTVAVRIPAHETARRLIRLAGVPVAAPSANRSGRPSPTRAWHVFEDLDGLIPFIIDDGPCEYGLESTVLDLSGSVPTILRPGAVTAVQIKERTGIHVKESTELREETDVPRSPGMKYRHYAPDARVWIASGDDSVKRAEAISEYLKQIVNENDAELHIGLFASSQTRGMIGCSGKELRSFEQIAAVQSTEGINWPDNVLVYIDYAETPVARSAAGKLFSALRRFDQIGADIIIAEALPAEGMGNAYMNRLNKAAGGGEPAGGRK